MSKTNYPLYSGTLEGDVYDEGKCFQLVIVTHWSSRKANATEILHKAYYFEKTRYISLSQKLDDEQFCMQIFEFPEYSKLKLEIKEEIVRC